MCWVKASTEYLWSRSWTKALRDDSGNECVWNLTTSLHTNHEERSAIRSYGTVCITTTLCILKTRPTPEEVKTKPAQRTSTEMGRLTSQEGNNSSQALLFTQPLGFNKKLQRGKKTTRSWQSTHRPNSDISRRLLSLWQENWISTMNTLKSQMKLSNDILEQMRCFNREKENMAKNNGNVKMKTR